MNVISNPALVISKCVNFCGMRNLIEISVADFSLRREIIIVQVDDGFVRNDVEDF
jgi:hypothetical protein